MAPKASLSPDQIKAALKAGIISQAQAKAMNSGAPSDSIMGDEENLRFARSFSDIFIGLGLSLFALGLWFVIGMFGGGYAYLVGALAMAGGAEYFARKKRAHFPTWVLALCFLIFASAGLGALMPSIGAAALTLGAMALFYARYRLPFCMALMAISAVMLLTALIPEARGPVSILSGIALFIAAIAYDMRDPKRLKRFSDNAFWLHFVAAPLFIHGVGALAIKANTQILFGIVPMPDINSADAAIVLAVIAILSIIALAINRRALIAASLLYAGIAIGFLVRDTGLNATAIISISLIVLGAGIVFLGVGWHGARRALLKILPRKGIWARIFPPVKPAT